MAYFEQRFITASDGIRLHFRHWHGEAATQGVVVGLHGIQSHSQWYEYSSSRMTDAGFPVYFADRRGSGLNGRYRGHADHGERLLNDVRQLIRLAARENPNVPITLLGLSWGGKMAAAFAGRYPGTVQRLALLYPGLCPAIRPNRWQRFLLSFARSHDLRHKPVALPLNDPALFTDDPHSQQGIANDPLALEFVTSGLLNAGRDLDAVLKTCRHAITQPTLLMLAGRDRIIDNAKTRRLVEEFASQQLTCQFYRDACHTLEFDPQKEQFVSDLIAWLKSADSRNSL